MSTLLLLEDDPNATAPLQTLRVCGERLDPPAVQMRAEALDPPAVRWLGELVEGGPC